MNLPARLRTRSFRRNLLWFVMCLPALTWIFIFKYLTMAGVSIAFLDYIPRRGVFGSDFVGLENFQYLFSTDIALRALRNTVLLNLFFISIGLVCSLLVAWLIYIVYRSRLTRFYQTALLLPNFISWVIVSYFVYALLKADNGLINGALTSLGLQPVDWYVSPQYWPIILLLCTLWSGVGWGSLIYLSGMLGIDPEVFESATMDGAGKLRQFWSITLPLILPLIVLNLIMSVGHVFSADFSLFFQVPRDQSALYPATDVIDTFIYRSLIGTGGGTIGMASAAQFFQSVVGFILVLAANWLARRFSPRGQDLSLF